MITHFRLGLIAVAWIVVQAILVADVIYRVSQASL
jgi:expansin (peptidoglycan-binding protein)